MNALLGVVLILSLLIIIFLGPEYLQTVRRKTRSYKKSAPTEGFKAATPRRKLDSPFPERTCP